MQVKLSKTEWERVGLKSGWLKKAGINWYPANLSERLDKDVVGALTPDEEEELLLGANEKEETHAAYFEGYEEGLIQKKKGNNDNSNNPYRYDTEAGRIKFDEWMNGFTDAFDGKPNIFKNKFYK
jgi:hypothetical protein